MSAEDIGEDLINFEAGSPELPSSSLSAAATLLDNENGPLAETLLDSELLLLEQRLQTASLQENSSKCDRYRDSVELDEVLITIDDEEGTIENNINNEIILTSPSISRRSSIENIEEPIKLERRSCSSRKNSLDITSALEELDKIINESSNATNDDVDGLLNPEEKSFNIEDCLRELDIYLQGFDTSGSEVADGDLDARRDQQTPTDYVTVGVMQGNLDNATDITEKLRKLASHSKTLNANFNLGYESSQQAFKRNGKFRATIATNPMHKNKDYVDPEEVPRKTTYIPEQTNGFGMKENNPRPLSADYSNRFLRNDQLRATIASFGRSVPNVRQIISRRQSINKYQPQINCETDDENEDIDWSWVHDMVIENNHITAENDSELKEDVVVQVDEETPNDQIEIEAITTDAIPVPVQVAKSDDERVRSTWLRSSMRRLRHFRLPSDPTTTTPTESDSTAVAVSSTSTTSTPILIPSISDNTARPVLLNVSAARPVSAPVHTTAIGAAISGHESRSRASVQIPTTSTGVDHGVRRVPRSRSSDPNLLRPRSGSESSRSRSRPRSLSSSESSLASSVDSSPSCTPAGSPTRAGTQPDTAAPASGSSAPRR